MLLHGPAPPAGILSYPTHRVAERVGFEPTWELPPNPLSRRARYDHFGTSPSQGS